MVACLSINSHEKRIALTAIQEGAHMLFVLEDDKDFRRRVRSG